MQILLAVELEVRSNASARILGRTLFQRNDPVCSRILVTISPVLALVILLPEHCVNVGLAFSRMICSVRCTIQ